MRAFSYLMSSSGGGNSHYVELLEDKFRELLNCMLVNVAVDEDWYLQRYEDVRSAVRSGTLASAREHYVRAGYYENRFPRPIAVDEAWYLSAYPDVAEAIKAGAFLSATEHFERDGFKEGRLPQRGWSLLGKPALEPA